MDASHVPTVRYRIAKPPDRSLSSAQGGASDRHRPILTLGPTKARRILEHQFGKQVRSSAAPSASHVETRKIPAAAM